MSNIDRKCNYKIGKRPNTAQMKSHNAYSWQKIERKLNSIHGSAPYDVLCVVVKDHESGSKNAPHPYQFVDYCINQKWLMPA